MLTKIKPVNYNCLFIFIFLCLNLILVSCSSSNLNLKIEEERISDLLGLSATSLTKLPRLIDYFDKINVERHLSNKDFVDAQIKCLVYDGPCGIFGRRAKVLLPAVILDNCRLCSSEQKNKLSRVVVHLQQNYPGAWRDALVKYGGAPRFITAGHVAPQTSLFGSQNSHNQHNHLHQHRHNVNNIYQVVPPSPTSSQQQQSFLSSFPAPIPPGAAAQSTSTIMIPIMLYSPSSPPDPNSAVESPTGADSLSMINYEPTQNPNGDELTSSSSSSSADRDNLNTPGVVESTLDFKPTTLQSSFVA